MPGSGTAMAGSAWFNEADQTNYAARRPVWNGLPLAAATVYRPIGVGGSSQAWTQVRGFAKETMFGLALDTSTPGKLVLRRATAGGQKS